MTTFSPNMNLSLSTVGVDSGLLWEQNLNSSLSIVDAHDHSPGNGVQITPSGLNINSTLGFNNNSANNVSALTLNPQTSLSTLYSVYSIGKDLYFNDGNSNVIQLTASGAVNASSSGLTNGTGSASFNSSTLQVYLTASATTPANIQGGSFLLGNNSVGSKFLTLSPPAAMAANFSLTLPSLPAQTNIMTLDSSGNMSAVLNVDNSSLQNSGTVLSVKNAGVTRPMLAALGQQISSSCGAFSSTSSSYIDVTNLTVTITTTGRPVFIGLIPDGTTSSAFVGASANQTLVDMEAKLLRGATNVAQFEVFCGFPSASTNNTIFVPPGSIFQIDTPAAGTYVYKLQAKVTVSGTFLFTFVKLIAYEIG